MSNRIDLFAFLHANRRSIDNTKNDIAEALRQGGREGSEQMAREIENASPRIRRATNRIKDATIDANRAERALNKTREDGLKILDRRIELESELGARHQRNIKERSREIDLEQKAARERRGADAAAIRTYNLEKKVLDQRQKLAALNAFVKDKNLGTPDSKGIRDLRLDAKEARQSGDRAKAQEIAKQITAAEKELQPARKAQAAAAKQLKADEAELARSREVSASRTLDAKNAEADLNEQRKHTAEGAKDVERIESELAKTREESRKNDEALIRTSEDVERANRRREESVKSLHDTEEAERLRSERANRGNGRHPGRRIGGILGNAFTDIPGVPGGPVGAIVGPAVITIMGSVAEAAVTASQALALLPAIAVAAGAGVATLAIGMDGFGKALKDMGDPKKFAKDLALLGPAAQQAALEIQFLSSNDGPLGQLKRQTEETLFKGVPESLHGLANTFSPMLTELTTGIGGAFNTMFNNLAQTLQGNGEQGTIHAIIQNIVQSFQQLAPAVKPFTDAFLRIIQVGSSFLPNISTAIVNMANHFNDFIQKAAADGSFQNFIQKGIDAVSSLGGWLLDLGKKIYEVFGNKSPEDFRQMLDNLTNTLAAIGTAIVGIAELVNDILPTLNWIADAIGGWPVLITVAITAFLGLKTVVGPVLTGLVMSLGTEGIAGGLAALPGVAASAGAGIIAGLSGAAAFLARMAKLAGKLGFASSPDQKDLSDSEMRDYAKSLPPDSPIRKAIEQGQMDTGPKSPSQFAVDQLPPIPGWFGFLPGYPTDLNKPGGPVPTNGGPNTGIGNTSTYQLLPDAGLGGYHPFDVPAPPPPKGAGGSKKIHGPEVPYSGDPMQLIQGFQPTAALYNAAGSVIDKRLKVEQDQADLNALMASNTATQDDIQKKKNDLAKDDRERIEAELRLNEAKASAAKKDLKAQNDVYSKLGAGLDKDLGLSKGLPGLADNLVRFVASLATAPLMGQLSKMAEQGDGSYGLIGMMFGGPNPNLSQNGGLSGLNTASSTASSSLTSFSAAVDGATAALGGQGPGGINGGNGPGWFTGPGFKDAGGNLGAMMALAQSSSGKVKYGPASDMVNGLADCSGSISDLVEVLQTGHTNSGRLFTTRNFGNDADAAKLGFLPGYQPGALNVGVTPFGDGAHMAATLPNGVNFEGGGGTGGGAQYGGSATGAMDPQFSKHYYMPVGPGAQPPSASTPGIPPLTSGPLGPGGLAQPDPATAQPIPGLSLPGGPGGGGGGPGMPLPRSLGAPNLGNVSPGYTAQDVPQAQGGWQPQGGGGIGMGGGLMGAAMSAGSMAADMFAPGAGAAAQTAMQLINRTIKFGGQAAGIAAEGLIDTFTPTNPDTGKNPLEDSWLWRVAGALAGAAPALGSGGAGDQDKAAQKRQQQEQGQQQQGGDNHTWNAPQNLTQNINVAQGANQSGKSVGQDAANQLQQQVYLPR